MAVTIARRSLLTGLAGAAMLHLGVAAQQSPGVAALHARIHKRLIIKNAMVIYGNARPPYGPVDIVIEDGRIASVSPGYDSGPPASSPTDATIDATGKYVMPGI